jgi:hypothetical protein
MKKIAIITCIAAAAFGAFRIWRGREEEAAVEFAQV